MERYETRSWRNIIHIGRNIIQAVASLRKCFVSGDAVEHSEDYERHRFLSRHGHGQPALLSARELIPNDFVIFIS